MSAFESPDSLGLPDLTPEQVRYALRNIHKLPKAKQARTLEIIKELTERKRAEKRRSSLLEFVKFVDKDYKVGSHHRKLAGILEDMAYGRQLRATISMPPRFGKSLLTSTYFPAWYIGNFPDHQIMMVSHTADLAVDFGRKVRNIVSSAEFKSVFPGVELAPDSKSAGRWNTSKGGTYYAAGVGGAIAGRGADFLCLAGCVQVKTKDDGVIPIRDLKVGAQIATVTGWEKVTNKWLTIHSEMVRINSIEASMQHPFMTPRGWVLAGELRVGDRILTQTIWRKLWTTAVSHLKPLLARLGKV